MATLDLIGLLKVYGNRVRAVDAIELKVQHGELISLLGPSGCGKTTTLRLVAGFIQPDGGEIRLDNQVISNSKSVVPPERRNMSMIFQSYAIWPHKTVSQNVAYGLKFRDVTRHEADRKVKQMLSVVKMEHLADRYPAELSGGQQQRVALARALVVEPNILLLDEPLSNLDANLREEMRFEVRRLHDEFQITSIYVTHDQSEAMVTSDRICVVKMEHLADRYPAELSGGQQQRVALARALVVEPNILLLDEPLSNLDANLREEMRFEVRRLHDEFQITSIYVTHDQSEAMVTSDRICVMNQGRLEQVGTPEEIYDRPRTRFVAEFVGKTNLLSGTVEENQQIGLGSGLLLHVRNGENLNSREKVCVSVRPHNIQLIQDKSEAEKYADRGFNLFTATVGRRIYFGDAADYHVQLGESDLTLRVIAPASQKIDAGQKVFALAHPDHCVVIRED